jgi:hypothetical protein
MVLYSDLPEHHHALITVEDYRRRDPPGQAYYILTKIRNRSNLDWDKVYDDLVPNTGTTTTYRFPLDMRGKTHGVTILKTSVQIPLLA